eukprot:scaffold5313_cov256-Pinguiococcus_pyrenoidosus.AAC.1
MAMRKQGDERMILSESPSDWLRLGRAWDAGGAGIGSRQKCRKGGSSTFTFKLLMEGDVMPGRPLSTTHFSAHPQGPSEGSESFAWLSKPVPNTRAPRPSS